MDNLTDTQFSLIKDIATNDLEFRALLQQRLERELNTAMTRVNQLKDAIAPKPVETQPLLQAIPKANKAAALREVLEAHPGSQVQELSQYLLNTGVEIESGMLSSYLYHMVQNGEALKKGKRGSFVYFMKK